MTELPIERQSRPVGKRSRERWRVHIEYPAYSAPLMTNTQAKKKCQRRPIASHCGPGIVDHEGNPRGVGVPYESFENPSTPVVRKGRPKTSVIPTGLQLASVSARIASTAGSPEYEDLPQ